MDAPTFALTLRREKGYRYTVEFDAPSFGRLRLDEPPPLGEGRGPNPARLLGAAVANCLAASLQHCLERAHVETEAMEARVEGSLFRNRDGRLRIGELRVRLEPTVAEESSSARVDRCIDLFEDFCIVTESVRRGIDVLVEVRPRYGSGDETEMQEGLRPALAKGR